MTDKYVATTGDNGAAGDIGTPWRTIQYGSDQLNAGDTLHVRGGTYVERLSITNGGTAGNITTIKSYAGELAVIDGEAGVGSVNAGLLGTNIYPNPSSIPGTDYQGWPIAQLGYTYSGLVDIRVGYLRFEGIKITRSLGRCVRIYPISDAIVDLTIIDCEMSFAREGVLYGQNWTDSYANVGATFVIDGCDFHDGCLHGPYSRGPSVSDWPAGVSFQGVQDCVVTNSKIHRMWGEGLFVQGNEPRHWSGNYITCERFEVSHCELYDNWKGGALTMASRDTVFDSNLIYNTGDLDGQGVLAGIGIFGNEPQYDYPDGIEGCVVKNNIVVGCKDSLVLNTNSPASSPRLCRDIKIFNNTFVNATRSGVGTWGDIPTWEGVNEFKNNIILQDNQSIPCVAAGSSLNNTWDCSYNFWSVAPSQPYWGGSNDLIGDPLLANHTVQFSPGTADANNYGIINGSRAIGAGQETALVTDDYFGNARSDMDMGMHEYGPSTAIATAQFTTNDADGDAPFVVSFGDQSIATNGIKSWLWAFGDGGSSNVQNPMHTYSEPGLYTVTLTIIANDDLQDTETKVGFITVTEPTPGTGTGANVLFKAGEFAAKTATGAQVISHSLGKVPKAIMFFVSSTTGDAIEANSRGGMGVTDGTNEWAVTTIEKDNHDPTFAGSYQIEGQCVVFIGDYEGQEWGATLQSWDADTFTLDWQGAPPTAWKVRFLAISGDDVTVTPITYDADYGANWNTVDVATQIELGYQPNLVIGAGIAHITEFWAGNSMMSYGVATNGQAAQCAAQWTWTQQASPSALGIEAVVRNNRIASWRNNWELELGYYATGVSLTPRINDLNGPFHLLCLKIDNTQLWSDIIDSPVATGVTAYTVPAFDLQMLMGFPLSVVAEDVYERDQDAGTNGVYLQDTDGEYSNAEGGEDQVWPSVNKGQTTLDLTVLNGATVIHKGAGSFVPNGWQWDMNTFDTTARKWLMLAVENATSPEALFSLNTLAGEYGITLFQVTDLSNAFGEAVTYSYDWGDLTAPDTSAEPNHVYAAEGNYTIIQTVTVNGVESTYSIDVDVYPPDVQALFEITVNGAPVTQVAPDVDVRFESVSIPGGNETVNLWNWELYTGNDIGGNKVTLAIRTAEGFTKSFQAQNEPVNVRLYVEQTGTRTRTDEILVEGAFNIVITPITDFYVEPAGEAEIVGTQVVGDSPVSAIIYDNSNLQGMDATRRVYEILNSLGRIVATISGAESFPWAFTEVGTYTIRYSVDTTDGSRTYAEKVDTVVVNPSSRHVVGPPSPDTVTALSQSEMYSHQATDENVHSHETDVTTTGEPTHIMGTDDQGGTQVKLLGVGTPKPTDSEQNQGIGARFLREVVVGGLGAVDGGQAIPVSAHLNPKKNYAQNLGSSLLKWGELWAASLQVETLVAQEVKSDIGGRVLIGPTNILGLDIEADQTYINILYDNVVFGDYLWFEGAGQWEIMRVTSDPVHGPGVEGYYINVNRAYLGVAYTWDAGTACMNTGGHTVDGSAAPVGFIDLYSRQSVRTVGGYDTDATGPSIVGNVRHSRTDPVGYGPAWAIGNLASLYGYPGGDPVWGAALGVYEDGTYVTIDSINGARFFDAGGPVLTIHPTRGIQIASDSSGSADEKRRISFVDSNGVEYGFISATVGAQTNILNVLQKQVTGIDTEAHIEAQTDDGKKAEVGLVAGHDGTDNAAIRVISDPGGSPQRHRVEINTKQGGGDHTNFILFNLPISSSGLTSGTLWNDNGTLKVA